MQDELFFSSAPQLLCKTWLLKFRITTHALLILRKISAGVFPVLVTSESKKSHPTLGTPTLITRQNRVQVYGQSSPHTISLNFRGYWICQFWSKTDRLILWDYNQNRCHGVWVFYLEPLGYSKSMIKHPKLRQSCPIYHVESSKTSKGFRMVLTEW